MASTPSNVEIIFNEKGRSPSRSSAALVKLTEHVPSLPSSKSSSPSFPALILLVPHLSYSVSLSSSPFLFSLLSSPPSHLLSSDPLFS
jgi:hypothetical protein